MFFEPFWFFGGHLEADENASIMGIMSPASVNSEGITPGIRERRDVFARGLLDPVSSRRHLIVFVHGMLGSRWDFQLYRNKILLARHNLGLPATDLCFLTSTSNEDDTFDDIGTLADNLVAEILEFVDSQVVDIDRMSFVCHSLGGLIARAAIEKPGMRVFHDIFHTFTTFATPHLSIAMTDNRILSLLGKAYLLFEKSPCIEQVLLRDASDKHECFLYRQAHSTQALERFKKICLFASAQDGYAGLGSALVADIAHGRVGSSSSSRKSERRAAACSVGGACEILRFGGGSGVPALAAPGSSPLSLVSPDNSSTGNDAPPPAPLTVSEAYDEMLSALEAGMARVKVERYEVWWPGLAGKMDALGRAAHIAMLQDEALSELATAIGRYYM
ncbi:putative serine esterase-domain-containing protein [Geranomyces variabilis]|nr:putative serine esterase-domain-containing protein [Geranomyces variabilis]